MILIHQDNTRPITDVANIMAINGKVGICSTDKKISVVETHPCPNNFDTCLVSLSELNSYKWDNLYRDGDNIILEGTGRYKIPIIPHEPLKLNMQTAMGQLHELNDIYPRHKNFYSEELNGYVARGDYILTTDGDTACITKNKELPDGVYDVDLFEIIHKIKEKCIVTLGNTYCIMAEHFFVNISPQVENYPKYDVLPLLTIPSEYDMIIPVKEFKLKLANFTKFETVTISNTIESPNGEMVESLSENKVEKVVVNTKILKRVLSRMKQDVSIKITDKLFLTDNIGTYVLGGIKNVSDC